MKIINIKEVEITDFEKELEIELIAQERKCDTPYLKSLGKYYVSFKGADVKERDCISSKSGDGNTVDEALKDYCDQISNKVIVFNAFTENRKEILFPKLIHTKFLNK